MRGARRVDTILINDLFVYFFNKVRIRVKKYPLPTIYFARISFRRMLPEKSHLLNVGNATIGYLF